MKLNLDFYKGSDMYSDGDIEKEILDYTENFDEPEFDQIFKEDIRWPVFYHLTEIRKNIINWYPIRKDASVLEIGAGMGAITSELCKKAKKVTCVELSKQRATAIANRNKDKENLEIIVGNLNDVKFNEKFDYITLIGVLEYAPLYTNTKNPFVDFLTYIKQFLKPNGIILIAIENKFGSFNSQSITNLMSDSFKSNDALIQKFQEFIEHEKHEKKIEFGIDIIDAKKTELKEILYNEKPEDKKGIKEIHLGMKNGSKEIHDNYKEYENIIRAMMNSKPDLAVVYHFGEKNEEKVLLFLECKFESGEAKNDGALQTDIQGLIA